MDTSRQWADVSILTESVNLPTYFEFVSLMSVKVELLSSLSMVEDWDFLVVPVWNAFGYVEDPRLLFFLERIDGSKCIDKLREIVLNDYVGEMMAGSSIIVPVGNKYICFVCLCRSMAFLPIDFAYNGYKSALLSIRNYRRDFLSSKARIKIVFSSFTATKQNLRDTRNICNQIALCIDTFFVTTPVLRSPGDLDQPMDFILHPRIQSKEEKEEELEGLLWSKEIEKRGLLSTLELDIFIDWIATDAPNCLSAATALCNLMGSQNQYALQTRVIVKAVSNNKACLKKLTSFISEGKIKVHKEIFMEELDIETKIGLGKTSKVYKAMYKNTQVAVKQMTAETNSELLKEIAFLFLLKSQYIVEFLGANIKAEKFIILELMEGSLYELLKEESFLIPPEIRLSIAIQCAKCVRFFHECGMVHRDLKSLNILVSSNFQFKLCDFGLSSSMREDQNMTANIGTVSWLAPEIFQNKSYNQKVDVYSFGVILWEILTRKEPFEGYSPIVIPMMVIKGDRPKIPRCEDSYKSLIQKCWQKKISKRPGFSTIVNALQEIYNGIVSKKRPEDIQHVQSIIRNSATEFQVIYGTGNISMEESDYTLVEHSETIEDSSISSITELIPSDRDPLRINNRPELEYTEEYYRPFRKGEKQITDFFSSLCISKKKGIIDSPFGDRYLLLNSAIFSKYLGSLLSDILLISKGEVFVQNFLYEIGYNIGYSECERICQLAGITEEGNRGVFLLPSYLAYTGWARCDTLPQSTLSDKVICWITRHTDTFNTYISKKNSCVVLSGIMAGWCTKSVGKDIVCAEYLCKCSGNEYCEFLISTPRSISKNLRKLVQKNILEYPETTLEKMKLPDFINLRIGGNWLESLAEKISAGRVVQGYNSYKVVKKKKKSNAHKRYSDRDITDLLKDQFSGISLSPLEGNIVLSDTKFLLVSAQSLVNSCHYKMIELFDELGAETPELCGILFSHSLGYGIGQYDYQFLISKFKANYSMCTETMKHFGWGTPSIVLSPSGTYHAIVTGSIEQTYMGSQLTPGYFAGFLSRHADQYYGIEVKNTPTTGAEYIMASPFSIVDVVANLVQDTIPPALMEKVLYFYQPLTSRPSKYTKSNKCRHG
eukprot:TRINITY_DN4143_c0_g1_i3.p1 TRINITY_DN4143_c0_g1~~TRINITY_DN4143_c0_g1_i3.p1  ORF type:complete len:1112 (+),score=207.23 TRINITY_DN4143_c0_g1_i3:89-3424(+)